MVLQVDTLPCCIRGEQDPDGVSFEVFVELGLDDLTFFGGVDP